MSSRSSITNHLVFTGGSCSGKTTTLEAMGSMGFKVHPEVSRVIIDRWVAQGVDPKLERAKSEQRFQQISLDEQLQRDATFNPDELHVLDLGIPCQAAFYQVCGLNPQDVLKHCQPRFYRRVFFFESVPFEDDYARTETETERHQIANGIIAAYLQLGYKIGVNLFYVPVFDARKLVSIHRRVNFILGTLY